MEIDVGAFNAMSQAAKLDYLAKMQAKAKAAMQECMANGEVIDLCRDCNSYEVAPALLHNFDVVSRQEWARQVCEHWTHIDNVAQYRLELLRCLLCLDDDALAMLMTAEEQAAHSALPDMVDVYRGCYEHNRVGLSWTLSKEVAKSFTEQNRYRHDGLEPLLLKAIVPKRDGFLKLGREEQEFVLLANQDGLETLELSE